MSKPDPFALLRTRADFTLEEAAGIVCDVPPSRIYPGKPGDWSQELRDERGRVTEALRELRADAEAFGVVVKRFPVSHQYRHNEFTGRQIVNTTPARVEYGRISREALGAWCESRQLRPEFFHPMPVEDADGTLRTTERETLLSLVAVLAEAAGLDLRPETKGHRESKRVAAWAATRKLSLTPETIAKKLVEGRTLIRPVGPERDSN